MASSSSEIVTDLSPVLKVYKDGTVERLYDTPYVPPSPEDPTTGVSSKDIKISSAISARLYLPKMTDPTQKLPILVYFHGGGFCLESAFSSANNRYLNLLVSEAKALAISVEYRLAPEHPLPAQYEDCWAALQWVASHSIDSSNTDKEPWLMDHGNFDKLYIGGDSSGGNIVHNIAMKAGHQSLPGDLKILGGFLSFPYFWGSNFSVAGDSTAVNGQSLAYRLWMFAYPSAPNGIDNPMINPLADDAPSLFRIGCPRLLLCTSEKDEFREPTPRYVEGLKKSGWKGEVELVDIEGEGHCFHMFNPDSEKARYLIKRLASFINA
nr:HID6 [Tabernanthe iboga]